MPEEFSVERRNHPWGEQGVRTSLDEVAKRAVEGATRPEVRTWAIECLDKAKKQGKRVSSDKGRAETILKACQDKLWVPDPVFAEYIPPARLLACAKHGDNHSVCIKGDDCFVAGTLTLTDKFELEPIESLQEGDRIWGLNDWSTVKRVWYKGILPIDVIKLNNGSELKLTADHHVYVLECQKHPEHPYRDRAGCSCSHEHRVEKRIKVSELREGMVLPSPERLPFGANTADVAPESADHAYIEGLYIADGWADHQKNHRFFISGQDGCPKEEQKRKVESICASLNINTSWSRKYLTVRDKTWTLRVQLMGRYAPEKVFLTLDLDEAYAAASLRGVMADAGLNTKGSGSTFTTTSRELVTQVRVLHKMFGVACGYRYIEDHGGLGRNPIHRLSTRLPRADGRDQWLLRVKRIDRAVISLPCWDITTSDHRVYLPEHDVTVSQCDGLVTLCAGAFMSVGLHTLVVGHGYGPHQSIQHVLTAVRIGKKWHYADPSTPETRSALPLGECIPFTRERLIAMPNLKVVCDDNVCLVNGGDGFDPEAMRFVDQGVFIGVNGTPREVSGLPFAKRFRWLGRGIEPTRLLAEQGLHQEETSRKLSITDKIALAGVLLSAVALAYQISRE